MADTRRKRITARLLLACGLLLSTAAEPGCGVRKNNHVEKVKGCRTDLAAPCKHHHRKAHHHPEGSDG